MQLSLMGCVSVWQQLSQLAALLPWCAYFLSARSA